MSATRMIATLVFDIAPSDDAELSCLVCQRNLLPCDLSVVIYRNGETAVAGLHEACVRTHMTRRQKALSRANAEPALDSAHGLDSAK
jgi:hypothetical protein